MSTGPRYSRALRLSAVLPSSSSEAKTLHWSGVPDYRKTARKRVVVSNKAKQPYDVLLVAVNSAGFSRNTAFENLPPDFELFPEMTSAIR
jgi:hypothetical protein